MLYLYSTLCTTLQPQRQGCLLHYLHPKQADQAIFETPIGCPACICKLLDMTVVLVCFACKTYFMISLRSA